MAWVDYEKVYDMVPHSQIITTIGMVGLADNIIGLIKQSMNTWKTNLYALENYSVHCPLGTESFKVTCSHHYYL